MKNLLCYGFLFILTAAQTAQPMDETKKKKPQKPKVTFQTPNKKSNDISIQWAAGHGDFDTVNQKLEANPSCLNSTDKNGETALHWSAGNNHFNIVTLLLKQPKVQINARNNKGQTPLAWASYKGHTGMAQLLLDNGANPELKDNEEKTPFQWASGAGKLEIMKLLFGTKKCLINQQDKNKQTALHWAVWGVHKEATDQLLAWGADCNIQNHKGYTPLMYVVQKATVHTQKNVVDIIQALLNHGAQKTLKNNYGETAKDLLSRATFISQNNKKQLEELLS
ncbi:MAG: ankyrin repeat domain-containing protein [Candidatus Babeliales bacterium]